MNVIKFNNTSTFWNR